MKRFLAAICCFIITAVALPAAAVDPADLLAPDQAFAVSASRHNDRLLRVEWNIADGYYLYKKRFQFSTDTPGIRLGAAVYPLALVKTDKFFGETKIYRDRVAIDIPFEGDAAKLTLTALSQGCADVGVCYPPHKQTVTLTLSATELPDSGAASTTERVTSFLSSLGSKFGAGSGSTGSANKFLEPDRAFAPDIQIAEGNTLIARWDIAQGYYMYRDKFAFTLVDAAGVELGTPVFPPGKIKNDESFGRMEVYYDAVAVTIPVQRATSNAAEIRLQAVYQGCADAGFCYPPLTKTVSLDLPATTSQVSLTPTVALPEQDRIARSLASDTLAVTLLTFFGFGLLLAFTPCVFPMIPILSGIIVGQGGARNTRKAFTLSAIYVLAMALTYTAFGVLAGLFGENLQAAAQNPWVLGAFSAVFVALALSMFGLYPLQFPSRWQSKVADLSNKQRGGTLLGVAVMGVLSALIVGPCVAAPLAAALIYIGNSGDAVLGGAALFALGLGMGAPLLAIGTSLGRWLPKAGAWMDVVKAVFGVLLLAVAIWMLERILPAALTMMLWAALFIISAIYMGALERLNRTADGWRTLWKGLGVVLLIYGGLLLIGAASGGHDIFRPLEALSTQGEGAAHENKLAFKPIKGVEQLEREIASASAQGKLVMLDFYADWCVACKEMEKFTFSDARVRQALSNIVLLQADVTANDEQDKALLRQLGVIGPPSILFFDADGLERQNYRLIGFYGADDFLRHIQQVLRG